MSARNARKTRSPALCDERDANRYVSQIIPWVLLGTIAYASYAVTKPLCIDYLIHPQSHYARKPRIGAGVAIVVVFYVLLFPVIATYLRLYYVVMFNPDLLPRGASWTPPLEVKENETKFSSRRRRRNSRSGDQNGSSNSSGTNREKRRHSAATKLTGGVAFPLDDFSQEAFWTKNIFICQDDGRPAYCSKCCQFKTDRSHHNSVLDRCVRKLDHFCPWVGGVVSESSYKFFLQFLVYTAFFTGFSLVVLAIFVSELHSDTGSVNAHWAVALGLAAIFFLFSAGMSGTSLQLASINSTTVENLNRRSKIWNLAIYIPPHQLQRIFNPDPNNNQWAQTFPTVTYPLQQQQQQQQQHQQQQQLADSKSTDLSSTHHPNDPSTSSNGNTNSTIENKSSNNTRTFAILRTQPGENPFDLGDPIKNLQQAMGYTLWDWLLPLKASPCVDHTSQESAYPMGPVVERLKREAGLTTSTSSSNSQFEDGRPEKRSHQEDGRRHRHRRWHREPGGEESSAKRNEEG